MLYHMNIRKITQDSRGCMIMRIPAFIRDHLGLKNGDEVSIEFDGEVIVVRPISKKGR